MSLLLQVETALRVESRTRALRARAHIEADERDAGQWLLDRARHLRVLADRLKRWRRLWLG